jgi:long-chain fatty acid transport protein
MLVILSTRASATNGYFMHGVGQKAMGMGGVGIAFPQDALAAAANPAGTALVGNRMDLGASWFRPDRSATLTGTPLEGHWDGRFDGNDTTNFLVPEFGYNRVLDKHFTAGLALFGAGGMNTDYGEGIRLFNGRVHHPHRVRMDLVQIIARPTLGYRLNDRHALGFGINLVAQAVSIEGLYNFDDARFTTHPGKVTDNGYDWSHGLGFSIGWVGRVTERITLGATWSSRTWMSDFDGYKGLFAGQGGFDIPESYGLGVAFQATDGITLAGDILWIGYHDIRALGNGGPSTNRAWRPLGSRDGAGFGWNDQTLYKIGLAWRVTPRWTLRIGYNHGDAPMGSDQTLLNILAPATVEDHFTLGLTWKLAGGHELTLHYMHAFEKKIQGRGSITPSGLPDDIDHGEADIRMSQDSLGIGYSWKR